MQGTAARSVVHFRYVEAIVLVACVAGAIHAALSLGQDANWDLQNYHFYDPWAWLAGRIFDWDVAAAQVQTFHNPLPDVPFYLLVNAGIDPRLITSWLALPTGLAAFFAIGIAWLLFADLTLLHRFAATAAAIAIGFTGTMGVGQLGSTTDEWLVGMFAIASLYVLVREQSTQPRFRSGALLVAGLLIGLGSGLKLTAATYAVGLCVALLALHAPWKERLRTACWFSAGIAVGVVITLGPWAYALWTHYGNPLFPYGNQWFKSPWWDIAPVLPKRFGPHTMREWPVLPFKLLAPPPGFSSEVQYVDARMAVVYALALIIAGVALVRRIGRVNTTLPAAFRTTSAQWWFVSVTFAASFVVWAYIHSILRYTIPLEILSGLLIVGAIGFLSTPLVASVAVACTTFALLATTVNSDWGRVPFGSTWFDVSVPPVEPNALVLLALDAPMAYVLPFFPTDARHVGIRNNANDPGRHNLLADRVRNVVREHRGPLYALAFPKGAGDADLQAHGLRRVAGTCAFVRTNMSTSPIELCRLARIASVR
jgi:MFS family permease